MNYRLLANYRWWVTQYPCFDCRLWPSDTAAPAQRGHRESQMRWWALWHNRPEQSTIVLYLQRGVLKNAWGTSLSNQLDWNGPSKTAAAVAWQFLTMHYVSLFILGNMNLSSDERLKCACVSCPAIFHNYKTWNKHMTLNNNPITKYTMLLK